MGPRFLSLGLIRSPRSWWEGEEGAGSASHLTPPAAVPLVCVGVGVVSRQPVIPPGLQNNYAEDFVTVEI